MHASCFEVTFRIPAAASLKEKRMVVKSVKERCKSRFNVSVTECGDNDKWQICRMGFALAAAGAGDARQLQQQIIRFLYDDDRIVVSNIEQYMEGPHEG